MEEIWGEISSLSKYTIDELKELYQYKVPYDQIISIELLEHLKKLTIKLQKEIAVYIDRKGKIIMVNVGTSDLVKIPEMWSKRDRKGYSGIRCIHTHPSGDSRFSSADISALINLRLDLMIALGIGQQLSCSIGFLQSEDGQLTRKFDIAEGISINKLLNISFSNLILNLEKQIKFTGHKIEKKQENAILVILEEKKKLGTDLDYIINELINLTKTAGIKVVDIVTQKREKPDTKFFIGRGKLDELAVKIQNFQADCLIFEEALSIAQQNNLINYLGIKVLDRTNLILDIFAQRAKSKEGKLQVELAQLNYLLPRLTGQGVNLSRLGGGVGTRGPGETKLETDRRHIRRRIQSLKNEILEIEKHRNVQKSNRMNNSLPQVALVGYTNAGKSSLLNVFADDNVFVEDKLFATLDTTTRVASLDKKNHKILVTDTVGFIRNLPHQLISAFKATLEEVKLADLLLHVVDINNKNLETHIETVQNVLNELDVLDKPMIIVFNKIDLIDNEPIIPIIDHDYCLISCKNGTGLEQLKQLIKKYSFLGKEKFKFIIPYEKGFLIDKIYQMGKVEEIEHSDLGIEVSLFTKKEIPLEIKKYQIME